MAGYALTFAGCLLSTGHLADNFGAKTILLLGLTFFILTSLACSLAPSIQILIFFRLLQGLTAATLIPCSLALIHVLFQNAKERAKAIGLWGGMGGIAAASGAILGGLLTSILSWRMVFAINIPLGILALWLIYTTTTATPRQKISHFDIPGQLFAILSIASLAFALIEVSHFAWNSLPMISMIGLFIISLIAFVCVEKYSSSPMLPLSFFKMKNFSLAMIVGLFINSGLYGELFILPFYFEHIKGYSTLQTGFAILPLLLLVALASYLAGKVASIKGARLPLILGLIISFLGFLSLLFCAFR